MHLKNNWIVITTGLLAAFLASSLLLDLDSMFYLDWNNHTWLIEYFGESIKHGIFPCVINTKQLVGIQFPMFYGQKFYILAGLLSAFLGSAITVRIIIFMLFFVQFFQVYRVAMKAGSTRNISLGIAVMMTWAIYPLTNLYSRTALAEFFAVAFLTCALSSLLCVIISVKGRVSKYDIIAAGLFFVMAASTHPLTAVFGGLFLGVLGLTALVFCEMKRKLWLLTYFAITALFSFLVLSPWIYVISLFKDKLPINTVEGLSLFGTNILSMLAPFPFDVRSLQQGLQDVSTPYLDTQIVVPLVMLIAVFIYIRLREKSIKFCFSACVFALIAVSVGMLTISVILLNYHWSHNWFGGFFNNLQFAYRLTTYANLSIMVLSVILAGGMSRVSAHSKGVINVCLAFCIGISFSALMLKLTEVSVSAISHKASQVDKAIWAPLPFGSRKHLIELPESFSAPTDYTIVEGLAKDTVSGIFPIAFRYFTVSDGARFGRIEPLSFSLAQPTLVLMNLQPFPWNHLFINGVLQSQSNIISDGRQEAVLLAPGSYIFTVETCCNGVWKFLNGMSWVLLLGWIALYAVFVFVKIIKHRGSVFPEGDGYAPEE